MTVSNSSATSLLNSVLDAQTDQQDASVSVLKKAQDAAKQEGSAMVEMLERIGPQASAGRLDVYA